ncbi:MAG: hypothetical protein HWN81_07535 [Candidatus Lokiarchaeota archaeon]|nr:hypothetical protein [Candidatus Lokiarchaeota archaeon]
MKARKRIYVVFIILFLALNYCISVPNVSAPPPPPSRDQFIAEIFPNCTAPLQLSYTNTMITFDATFLSNKIDILFDANYTLSNQENTTTIPLILLLSLALNISEVIIKVFANSTPISHDLISVSNRNEIITPIDIQFEWFTERYPIILIKCNVTLLKNSTSVLRYHFNGSKSNPFDFKDLFYIVYHLGTSQEWIGNTTGRVELNVYGKQHHFTTTWIRLAPCHIVDIIGGKSYICEWNNTVSPLMDVGIKFYRETSPFEEMMEIIAFGFPISITITGIIIIVLIKRSERKKREIT